MVLVVLYRKTTAARIKTYVGSGVTFKEGGTNFTNSLLVGTDGTGTLNAADGNTGVGTGVLGALTTGDNNVAVGYECFRMQTQQVHSNVAVGARCYRKQTQQACNQYSS